MPESDIIGWQQDEEGIVLLTRDDPDQATNTMNQDYVDSMAATVERSEA